MYIAIDLETSGLNPRTDKILSWAIYREDGTSDYGLWDESSSRLWAEMARTDVIWVGHNIKFDLQFLRKAWSEFPYWMQLKLRDTLHGCWLLNENEEDYKLATLVLKYTGQKLKKYDEYGTQGNLFDKTEPIEVKCTQDVWATMLLFKNVMGRMEAEPSIKKVYENLYSELIKVIVEMEETGVLIDEQKVMQLRLGWEAAAKVALQKAKDEVGWNFPIGKNQKLSRLLFSERKLQPKGFMLRNPEKYMMKGKNLWKVNYDVLCEYKGQDKVVDAVLEFRDNVKLARTYAETWLAEAARGNGRIYSHFWQTGTDTGRWSSSDPVNWQNVPKGCGLREAIVAPPGYSLIYADYSQLELRLMAHASGDKHMVEEYNKEKPDLHQRTADACGCTRAVGKNSNFAFIYGVGATKFQRMLAQDGVQLTHAKCYQIRDNFYMKYGGIAPYHRVVEQNLVVHGYVETLLKRKRRLKEMYKRDSAKATRIAVNCTIQGSASDLMGLGMLAMYQKKDPRVRFFQQVHDSVTLLCPEEIAQEQAALLRTCLQTAVRLKVPLLAAVGIGHTLAEAEKNAK